MAKELRSIEFCDIPLQIFNELSHKLVSELDREGEFQVQIGTGEYRCRNIASVLGLTGNNGVAVFCSISQEVTRFMLWAHKPELIKGELQVPYTVIELSASRYSGVWRLSAIFPHSTLDIASKFVPLAGHILIRAAQLASDPESVSRNYWDKLLFPV